LAIAYGIPIQSKNDPYIRLAQESVKSITDSATPGHFLVNVIPSLKYVPEFIPGGGFKTEARRFKQSIEKLLNEPFQALLQAMVILILVCCLCHENAYFARAGYCYR